GLLFHAWERRHGWLASMALTSVVFGFYHPHFWSAFLSSILFVCVMRRTGSLRAAMIVNGAGNLSLWYPLLGRFLMPPESSAGGSPWRVHISCLVFVSIAVPLCVWLARDRGHPILAAVQDPDVPLSQ